MGKRLKLTNYGGNAIDNKIPGHSSKVIVRDWVYEKTDISVAGSIVHSRRWWGEAVNDLGFINL